MTRKEPCERCGNQLPLFAGIDEQVGAYCDACSASLPPPRETKDDRRKAADYDADMDLRAAQRRLANKS